jgi:hypothetical protein
MSYTVDRAVPLPDWAPRSRYPFAKMQIGDSILFRDPDEQERVLNAAYSFARRHGWKFVTRQTEDGMRIWRSK